MKKKRQSRKSKRAFTSADETTPEASAPEAPATEPEPVAAPKKAAPKKSKGNARIQSPFSGAFNCVPCSRVRHAPEGHEWFQDNDTKTSEGARVFLVTTADADAWRASNSKASGGKG